MEVKVSTAGKPVRRGEQNVIKCQRVGHYAKCCKDGQLRYVEEYPQEDRPDEEEKKVCSINTKYKVWVEIYNGTL